MFRMRREIARKAVHTQLGESKAEKLETCNVAPSHLLEGETVRRGMLS
jgi:hypothetical protein